MFAERNKRLESLTQKLDEINTNFMILSEKYDKSLEVIVEKEKLLNQTKELLQKDIMEREAFFNQKEKNLIKLYEEKSKGFPWFAEVVGEFYKLLDFEVADYLENKSHPAIKRAENIRGIAIENSHLRKKLKIAENFVKYYESLFPWISEYVGEGLDELLLSVSDNEEGIIQDDPVLKYIPKAEYLQLDEEKRNQKALDRYLDLRGKPWQIGRDYERYIGYLYEMKGFNVYYQGIEKGMEDLGLDLICKKGNQIEVVQCKCWAQHKMIHEKHINQLFGTTVKYYIDNLVDYTHSNKFDLFPELIKNQEIKATFITSTKLSETASKFAKALGIIVQENVLLERYPIIKCNISQKGEKIYHLPFDQQYDKTRIKDKGEFYAKTVREAMSKGFRRAFRWNESK